MEQTTEQALQSKVKLEDFNMYKHLCRCCGDEIAKGRWELGYKFCLPCGDELAKKVVRCVVPMHKSNYVLITDKDLLTGVNNKGGIVK
jgi:ribosomal protein L37AE/L43A